MPLINGEYLTDDEYNDKYRTRSVGSGGSGDSGSESPPPPPTDNGGSDNGQYQYKPGDVNTNNPWVDGMINRDKQSWEGYLRQSAAKHGTKFDPTDLEGVIRNISYAQNAGKNPLEFLQQMDKVYEARGAPTSGRPFDSQGPNYNQATNQLNPAGLAALAARQNPGMAGPARQNPGMAGPAGPTVNGAGRDRFDFNTVGSQFSDPYTTQLEEIARQQLETLKQPQSNPQLERLLSLIDQQISQRSQPQQNPELDKLLSFLDTRFNDLSTNPGYSPADQALLRTQALEPIEADRAASQKRALDRIAQRGMLPSSGVLEDEARQIDTAHDQLRGAAQRDLGINAITRRDQNLAQAQAIAQLAGITIPEWQRGQSDQSLSQLLGLGTLAGITIPGQQRSEDTQRRSELLNTANVLYQLPRQAMNDALNVVNGSPAPGDNFSQAVQLLTSQQNQQSINDQRNAAYWEQLGQLFGNLFGQH